MKKKKIGKWIGAIFLALLLYIMIGAVAPYMKAPEVTEETRKKAENAEYLGKGPSGERARILVENKTALAERIRLISQAKERVVLSTFDFRADESGKDMLAALQAAADRGVSVRVIVDGMSGFLRIIGNEYFGTLSAMDNVEIKIYNPFNFAKPWHLMARLHDKYLIVDHSAYILGGRNTFSYFLGDYDSYKNYDWDVLIYEQEYQEGCSMEQVEQYFESVWKLPESRLHRVKHPEKQKYADAGKELRERYEKMQEEHPDWFETVDYVEKTVPVNKATLLSNPATLYAKEPVVFYSVTELMARAQEKVRFHTPYILCNKWMLERLENVCATVPDVTMMTNSIANNGNPFGSMDYWKNKKKILDTGVHILEYDGGISYHGKCFTADDRIVGIGSFNWDMRSVYIDTELMLVLDSPELNTHLQWIMDEYEKEALTIHADGTAEAPEGMEAQEVSLKNKIQIAVLYMFGYWARFLM